MKNCSNTKGFTLVELLVAITIVAVLAVVGVVIFSGVQANARDSRRSQDLDAVATALESRKAPGSVYYTPVTTADFSAGAVPTDPRSATQKYCLWGRDTVPPVSPFTSSAITNVNWTTCAVTGITPDYTAVIATNVPAAADQITSWTICAKKEGASGGMECRYSKL